MEKLLHHFANTIQEDKSLLHLTIRLHVTLEVSTLCPETSQSDIHAYWERLSHELTGVRKTRQASHAKWNQVTQPFLIREMIQSLDHLRSPLLDSLQYFAVHLELESPELDRENIP
ncbi:hypothetical protein llap_8988 [Limosa lapponica baueri]|uniref:Uncharacterized protein n=1 Tax=Limosa lapponica baueri TaxID=1758121 RepID=A0A2I0U3P4_LIMLA|nr:hypothetical protein llap_8988 [Limosa lapponica baueri]